MALDVSKISTQGLGVLNANASMVSGSAPQASFNVKVAVSKVEARWDSDGLLLENVSNISGSSSFTISPKPGYNISASMFKYRDDQLSYISAINFSNTADASSPFNTVVCEVVWVTQNVTQDIDIALSNIEVSDPTLGTVRTGYSCWLMSPGFNISQESNFLLNSFQEVPGGFKAVSDDFYAEPGQPVLLTVISVTSNYSNGYFTSDANVSVSDNGSNVSIQKSFTPTKQTIKVYFTPSINLSENDIQLIINTSEFTYGITALNESGLIQNEFQIPGSNVNDPTKAQRPTFNLQEEGVRFAEAVAYNYPYDGSTLASWITSFVYTEQSTLSNGIVLSTLNCLVSQNTGADRSAVIQLRAVVGGGPVNSFIITQSDNSFLELTPVSYIDLYSGEEYLIDSNSNDTPLNVGRQGALVTVNASIESSLTFTEASSSISESSDGLGIESSGYASIQQIDYQGNTAVFKVNIAGSNVPGVSYRSANLHIQHPYNNTLIKTLQINQDRAYDPNIDSLTYWISNSIGIVQGQDIEGNTVDVSPTLGFMQFVQLTVPNQSAITLPGELDSANVYLQMQFNGDELISEPILARSYTSNEGNEIFATFDQPINSVYDSFNDWVDMGQVHKFYENHAYTYNWYTNISLEDNDSFTSHRSVNIEIHHPHNTGQNYVNQQPAATFTITQLPKFMANFGELGDQLSSLSIDTGDETPLNDDYVFDMFATLSQATVRLESVVLVNEANDSISYGWLQQQPKQYFTANSSGTTGATSSGINSISLIGGSDTNNNSNQLKVNLSPNNSQLADTDYTRFKYFTLVCWPGDEASNPDLDYIVQESSTEPGGSIAVWNKPYSSKLIIKQHPFAASPVINATGFMISTNSFNPSAYSIGGEYLYTTPSFTSTSEVLFINSQSNLTIVNLKGVPAANGTLMLNNSLTASVVKATNSEIVLGIDTHYSNNLTIEFLRQEHITNNASNSAFTTVSNTTYNENPQIVQASNNPWGDAFDRYFKLELKAFNQFNTSSGHAVTRVGTLYRVNVGDTSSFMNILIYQYPNV